MGKQAILICLMLPVAQLAGWQLLAGTATRGASAADVAATGPSTREAELAIVHGPYLQAPSETGVTIVWVTNRKCAGRVEYGPAFRAPVGQVAACEHGLIEANTTLHRVRLTGLKPGVTYWYRVVCREIVDFQPYKVVYGQRVRGPLGRYTALDRNKSEFSFLMINDRHERVGGLKSALYCADWEGVDLVIFNGDMINDPQSLEQVWRGVVDPASRIFAENIPFILIRGNHETRGALARELLHYFPTESMRYYYLLRHGPACFMVLDAGEDKADGDPEYSGLAAFDGYRAAQTEWLKEQMEGQEWRKAEFRIVLVHIPPRNNPDRRHIREKWVLENWGPLFNEGRVDLVLSGHTHRFEDVPPQRGGNRYHLVIGGTDTVAKVKVSRGSLSWIVTNNDGTAIVSQGQVRRR